MSDGLVAIAVLGLLAGGAIVVIDSLILRRLRRSAKQDEDPQR